MENIIKEISKRFEISDIIHRKGKLSFLTCKKQQAISLVTHMKDIQGYTHLVLLSAVDWIEDNLFQITYFLNNPTEKNDIGIRVFIDRQEAEMDSAHHLWQQVATYQRELKEMYGINFPGSPRIDESFILEGWDDIPPNRRDFLTKEYSEKTYFPRSGRGSNDPAEYMKKKLYPNEK